MTVRSPQAWRHLATVGVLLGVYDVVRRVVIPAGAHFATNLAMVPVLLLVARRQQLGRDELGLEAGRAGEGLRLGLAAFGAISTGVALGAAIPATRGLFDDDRGAVGAAEMVGRALIVIPLGTVLLEEVAFRGVVLAGARRAMSHRRAGVAASVLFGLWHVPPLWSDGLATIAGTVAATTVAGLGFVWLRLRSGSLLAPMLAHVATNSSALVAAWVVQRPP